MITFYDPPEQWSKQDRQTVYIACRLIGLKLAPFTGTTYYYSFKNAFGDVTACLSPSLATPGHATENRIEFRPASVNDWNWIEVPLVVHELGHLFNLRRDNLPMKMLRASGFMQYLTRTNPFLNGLQWLGSHPNTENESEVFANLFESWALGLIYPNVQGRAMLKWWEASMPQWLGGMNEP